MYSICIKIQFTLKKVFKTKKSFLIEAYVHCPSGSLSYNNSIDAKYSSLIIDSSCERLLLYSLSYSSITQIKLPDTLIQIDDDAFYNIPVREIDIPASTIQISTGNPFNYAHKLEKIVVNPLNPSYASVDYILYNKNIDTLIHVPRKNGLKVYVAPRSLKKVQFHAFFYHETIESIVFQSTINIIEERSFQNATTLESILIPNGHSIKRFGKTVFLNTNFNIDNITAYTDLYKSCRVISYSSFSITRLLFCSVFISM